MTNLTFIHSPLEQFDVKRLVPIELFGLNLSISNATVFMFVTVATVLLYTTMATRKAKIVPSRWQLAIEMVYDFVLNIVTENIGSKGYKYFPLLFTTFIFILFANLLGMVPYTFTVTSHLIVTFSLALSIFIGVNIIGFYEHGIKFFSFFLAPGISAGMAPIIVSIEFISHLFKPLSLSIRLFANMMAGHTLLKIMATFAWTMFGLGGILAVAGIVPVILLFAFTALEIAVAVLQAYVFTILVSLYLNDSINLH